MDSFWYDNGGAGGKSIVKNEGIRMIIAFLSIQFWLNRISITSEDYAKSTVICNNFTKKKEAEARWRIRPHSIAYFSKCDFWNLGDFWNRNMWSKKLSSKTF